MGNASSRVVDDLLENTNCMLANKMIIRQQIYISISETSTAVSIV